MFLHHSLPLAIFLCLASFVSGAEEAIAANAELRTPSDSVPSLLANAPPPARAVLATQQQQKRQEQESAEEETNVPLRVAQNPSQFVPLVPFRAGQFVLPRRVANGARTVPFRAAWNVAGGAGANRVGRGPIIGPDGSLIRPAESEAIALLAGRSGFFRQPIIGTPNEGAIGGNEKRKNGEEKEERRREEKRLREEEKNRKEEEGEEKGRSGKEKEERKEKEEEDVGKNQGKQEEEEEKSKNRKWSDNAENGGEENSRKLVKQTEKANKKEQLKKVGKPEEEKKEWEKNGSNIGERRRKGLKKVGNEKEEEVEKATEERIRRANGSEKGEEKVEETRKNEKRERGEEDKKESETEELIIEEEQKVATEAKKEKLPPKSIDKKQTQGEDEIPPKGKAPGGKGQLVVKESGGKVILDREAEGTAALGEVPTKCEDRAQNCAANSDYCADAHYQELMVFNCAKTCKVCPQDISNRLKVPPGLKFPPEKVQRGAEEKKTEKWATKCRDLSDRCQFWIQHGFCESRLFHRDLKKRFCARSCGHCQPPDNDNGKAPRGDGAEAVPLTENGQ